jgi:small subunit ribosomal protein S2
MKIGNLREFDNRRKTVAFGLFVGILIGPFGPGCPTWWWRALRRENGHNFPPRMRGGGQNNIDNNPVFRGMVRSRADSNKRKKVLSIGIKELLDAGVHFGHQTRRWNPKMKPFIFDARNGIHIIDLSKTLNQLDGACNFLSETVRKGGKALFVGTKKQAQQAIKETAKECGQFYVTERWLGGTLTNFATIKKSIGRLKQIEKMETDGSINNYVKQEQSMIRREAARLVKFFEGIRSMEKLPGAIFIVDIKREHNAVAEARRLKIPVVAIVDTNCDPDLVDFPVAGNDDAIRSVRMILATIGQVVTQAQAEYEAKYARRKPAEEQAQEQPVAPEAAAAAPAAILAPPPETAAAPAAPAL